MGRAMLFLVSGLVILTGVIQLNNAQRATLLPERSIDTISELQARNSVNSLMQTVIEKIRADNSWEGTVTASKLLPGQATVTTYDEDNIGELMKKDSSFTLGSGGWDGYKVLLFGEAEYGNKKVITEVLLTRDSFSKYSYFSDMESSPYGSKIFFYDSDVVNGPVHTNGTFNMSGSPVFNGHLSSPNRWRGYYGSVEKGATPQFNGTTDFTAKVRTLPNSSMVSSIKTTAQSEGLTFDKLSYVIMKSDGSVDVNYYMGSRTGWVGPYNYSREVHNGIISSSSKIYLEGTVNGPMTIHSEDEVELYGDIQYNKDPRVHPESPDILGVVSEGDILIDANAHKRSGSKDLTLHGSYMALGDSFKVENHTTGWFRGDLNLLGGIIQKVRGPVGTFGRYGSTGFSKKYDYDVRLGSTIPPHFPREKIFTVYSWKDRIAENTNY